MSNSALPADSEEPPSSARLNSLKAFHPAGRGFWANVPDSDWNDWHWQLKHRITRLEQLERLMPTLTPGAHACEFGVTFYGWGVSEKVVRFFTERGFRNFGVEMNGLAATRLLLGRQASQPDAFGPLA